MNPPPSTDSLIGDERATEFVSHLAHSLNNAFGVIVGSLGFARTDLLRAEVEPSSMAAIEDALAAGRAGAESLALALACIGLQPLRPAPFALNDAVASVATLVESSLPKGIGVAIALQPDVGSVYADRSALERALLALTVNARQAITGAGTIAVSTYRAAQGPAGLESTGSDWLGVRVRDDGAGMDDATLASACQPYFTTGGAARAQGLGLSSALGFARQSGGDLRIRSAPSVGTEVEMLLPAPSP